MLARWSSDVLDRGDHLIVRTPREPDFWMGNALVVPPPEAGDEAGMWLARWQGTFERVFAGVAHRALLVDGDVGADVDAAVSVAGWVMQRNVALVAAELPEARAPAGVDVRVVDGDGDWSQVTTLALCSDEHAARSSGGEPLDDVYRAFVAARTTTKRAWCAAGRGAWWGAFVGGELVGSLGLFANDGLGRYQDVVTHPGWRRQGIARALLCTAGRDALARGVAKRVVIVAMLGSDAARLYRSVGFAPADVSSELLRKPR
jgi:ribosomal protein S18 acetylase RimI-like enzyme